VNRYLNAERWRGGRGQHTNSCFLGKSPKVEVLAGLVNHATRVRPFVRDSPVDPVRKLADVLPTQLLDGNAPASLLPLPESRGVLIASPA
jgi:hypothetical protein